jgi:RHS repeat-associated protein
VPVLEYDFFKDNSNTPEVSFYFSGDLNGVSIAGFNGVTLPTALNPCNLKDTGAQRIECRSQAGNAPSFEFVFNKGGFPSNPGAFGGDGLLKLDASKPSIKLRGGQVKLIPQQWHLHYQYDPTGNILRIDTGNAQTPKVLATYDALDRLQGAGGSFFGSQQFTYDSVGNIIADNNTSFLFDDPNHPYAVTAAVGRSVGSVAPTTSYLYDANGSRIAKSIGSITWSYAYDSEGRLATIRQNNTTLASYYYDAEGSRTKRVVGGAVTRYIGRLYETRPDGTQVVHIQANGLAVADIVSGGGGPRKINYFHQDHLGSVSLVSNTNGYLVERLEYDPFGSVVLVSGVTESHGEFTNQEEDAFGQGFYFYNSRYYDAQLRRFLSADSLVPGAFDPQALNRYVYCRNNPIIYSDPDGHSWLSNVLGGVAGVAVGALTGNPFLGFATFNTINTAVAVAQGGGDWVQAAISSGVTAGFAYAGGELGAELGGYVGASVVGGALSSAVSAEITGRNVGQAAIMGAVTAGIGAGIAPAVGSEWAGNIIAAGFASELSGSGFGAGARNAAEFMAAYSIISGASVFGRGVFTDPQQIDHSGAKAYLATAPMSGETWIGRSLAVLGFRHTALVLGNETYEFETDGRTHVFGANDSILNRPGLRISQLNVDPAGLGALTSPAYRRPFYMPMLWDCHTYAGSILEQMGASYPAGLGVSP